MTCSNGSKSLRADLRRRGGRVQCPDYGPGASRRSGRPPLEHRRDRGGTRRSSTPPPGLFESTITVNGGGGLLRGMFEGGGKRKTNLRDGSVVFTVTSAATYTITATTGTRPRADGKDHRSGAKTLTLGIFPIHDYRQYRPPGLLLLARTAEPPRRDLQRPPSVFMVHNAGTWQIAGSMNEKTREDGPDHGGRQSKSLNLDFLRYDYRQRGERARPSLARRLQHADKDSTGSVVFTVKEAGT